MFEFVSTRIFVAALPVFLAGLQGCGTTAALDFEPVIAQFFLETAPADPNANVVTLPNSKVEIPVAPSVVFFEGDIADVELVKVDLGLCLMFVFTPEAAKSLHRVSASNLGRRLVVTLNGRAFGARLFDVPIDHGRLFIFVELSDEELTETALSLKRTAAHVQEAANRGRS
ncbi:MAG: hypothetical protein ACREIA_21915 [Opitutaceae bacterium]